MLLQACSNTKQDNARVEALQIAYKKDRHWLYCRMVLSASAALGYMHALRLCDQKYVVGTSYAYTWRERVGRLPLLQAVSINAARHKGAGVTHAVLLAAYSKPDI